MRVRVQGRIRVALHVALPILATYVVVGAILLFLHAPRSWPADYSSPRLVAATTLEQPYATAAFDGGWSLVALTNDGMVVHQYLISGVSRSIRLDRDPLGDGAPVSTGIGADVFVSWVRTVGSTGSTTTEL